MEVQELIFTVHPGMTDHLRTAYLQGDVIFIKEEKLYNLFCGLLRYLFKGGIIPLYWLIPGT